MKGKILHHICNWRMIIPVIFLYLEIVFHLYMKLDMAYLPAFAIMSFGIGTFVSGLLYFLPRRAAITAGACALVMEWGMKRTPSRIFNNAELKSLLIRGAGRREDLLYPNREWGYGTLDVYQVFSSLSSP